MQVRSSRVKMRSRPIDLNKPIKLTATDVEKDEELEELILTVSYFIIFWVNSAL
jgi:hypothetical protein